MLSKVIFKGSVVCNSQGREEIIFLRLGPTGPRPNDICQGVLSMSGYHLKQKKIISSILLLIVKSWNRQHHGQTKHPTEKLITFELGFINLNFFLNKNTAYFNSTIRIVFDQCG